MITSKECRGITLTELLVAVAIVLLLCAISFPVFSAVKGSAQERTCMASLIQNGAALLIYTQDNDGVYPNHDQTNVQNKPGKGRGGAVVDKWSTTNLPNWSEEIMPYARSKAVLSCPANEGWADSTDQSQPPLTYVFNGWASERGQTEATTPSTLVMLYDCRFQTSWSTANPSAVIPRNKGKGKGKGNGTDGGTYFDIWNETNSPPHRVNGSDGRYNIVFLDGHTGSMGAIEFQSHAQYTKNKPPRFLVPPIPENHFAF